MQLLPITAVVPTLHRPGSLQRALTSLGAQDCVPAEIIVVDASEDSKTRDVLQGIQQHVLPSSSVRWIAASQRGAAAQRNQGCALATQPVLWFFDDDVTFESECLSRLWKGLQSDPRLGGVNAMITNQRYLRPGFITRMLFAVMNGGFEASYAGRVLGPAINILPEDREDLPEVVEVQWLNAGSTLYRREALPDPPFDSVFTGYSLMEDLTLSLRVARQWKLANVRGAKIFHDSQPGAYKSDARALSYMELVNRHYVMTQILGRTRVRDYAKLMLWELFLVAISAKSERLLMPFWRFVGGKVQALRSILRLRYQ